LQRKLIGISQLAFFGYTFEQIYKLRLGAYSTVSFIQIRDLQGQGYLSPYAGKTVTTYGVVTGVLRRGFYLQTPDKEWDAKGSDAIFVYSPEWTAPLGSELEVTGECVDYNKHDTAKPITQLRLDSVKLKAEHGAEVQPVEFTRDFLPNDNAELALLLNSLEGMLIRIAPKQTFIAPSNRYGDYVLALDADGMEHSALRNDTGGAIVESSNPLRWFPGFRVTNYNHAPRLNVGATLKTEIRGPLHYRVDSYQLSINTPFQIEEKFVSRKKAKFLI